MFYVALKKKVKLEIRQPPARHREVGKKKHTHKQTEMGFPRKKTKTKIKRCKKKYVVVKKCDGAHLTSKSI